MDNSHRQKKSNDFSFGTNVERLGRALYAVFIVYEMHYAPVPRKILTQRLSITIQKNYILYKHFFLRPLFCSNPCDF